MERRKHVLHLSNTFLEGEPARAAKMTDKYSKKFVARSICWKRPGRLCGLVTDMIGSEMPLAELDTWLEWADIIHYHDAYQSQQVLQAAYPTLPVSFDGPGGNGARSAAIRAWLDGSAPMRKSRILDAWLPGE